MNVKEILEKAKQKKFLTEGDVAVRAFMDTKIEEMTARALNEIVPKIVEDVTKIVTKEITSLRKDVKKGDKGEKGDRGEKGETGVGIDGKNGLDGRDGKDGKDGEDGKDGQNGKDGKDGKDGGPDSPLQIADKVNTLEEEVDMKVIKGLKKTIQVLQRNIQNMKQEQGGGGLGMPLSESFAGDGVTTQFTLTSNVSANGRAIWLYYNGQWLAYGTHYTVSGKIITLTFAPEAPELPNTANIDALYIRT